MSTRKMQDETKTCAVCGREMRWRKRWARTWDSIRYCSERCRREGVDATDAALEHAIVELLSERPRGMTICPSEAARRVAPDDCRALMERTRRAARRLTTRGEIEITQGGRAIDPSTARGPFRLRRKDNPV